MTPVPQTYGGVVFMVALLTLGTLGVPAGASPTDDKQALAAELASDLEARASEIVALDREHRRAIELLHEAEEAFAHAQQQVTQSERRNVEIREQLRLHAIDAYVAGGSVTFLARMARSDGSDVVLRPAYLRMVTGNRRQALEALKASRQDLSLRRSQLDEARAVARARANEVGSEHDQLTRVQAAQRGLLERVSGELASLLEAEQARRDAEAARAAAERPGPSSEPAPIAKVSPVPSSGSAPGGVWDCIRQLESGNNYASPGGGAYQFQDATWQSLGQTGTASDAPPHVQDAMALLLQERDGWRPWTTAPLCGRPE